MNIITAVNEKTIEKYVSEMKECNVLKVLKNKKYIIKETIELNPHLLLLSSAIPGKENIKEIILELRKTQPQTRIAYLYGNDDSMRKEFTNFLIENKVFDFHVGAIDEDVLMELILNPKMGGKIIDISQEEKEKILEEESRQEEIKQNIEYKIREEERQNVEKELKEKNILTEKTNEEEKQEIIENEVEKKVEERIIKEITKELEVHIINRVEEVEVEVEVLKNTMLGTAVICLVGTMHRVGTTHTAISMAKFLTKEHFKVALVEMHNSEDFYRIQASYEEIKTKNNDNTFILEGIDFFPYDESVSLPDILEENYNYVIIDMGIYEERNMSEFMRANERIVISGSKDWEIEDLEIILDSGEKVHKNKYYFTFTDNMDFIKSNMGNLECFSAPYNPDPFRASKENQNIFKVMLKDILPQEENKSGLFKFKKYISKRG